MSIEKTGAALEHTDVEQLNVAAQVQAIMTADTKEYVTKLVQDELQTPEMVLDAHFTDVFIELHRQSDSQLWRLGGLQVGDYAMAFTGVASKLAPGNPILVRRLEGTITDPIQGDQTSAMAGILATLSPKPGDRSRDVSFRLDDYKRKPTEKNHALAQAALAGCVVQYGAAYKRAGVNRTLNMRGRPNLYANFLYLGPSNRHLGIDAATEIATLANYSQVLGVSANVVHTGRVALGTPDPASLVDVVPLAEKYIAQRTAEIDCAARLLDELVTL